MLRILARIDQLSALIGQIHRRRVNARTIISFPLLRRSRNRLEEWRRRKHSKLGKYCGYGTRLDKGDDIESVLPTVGFLCLCPCEICSLFMVDFSRTGKRSSMYRERNNGLFVLLSRTQAGPGRTVKQEQEEISRNHIQTFICLSVLLFPKGEA